LLAPRPTPKLEEYPSSAVRDCLFNLFTATLHIGGRSSIRNLRNAPCRGDRDSHSWALSLPFRILSYTTPEFNSIVLQVRPNINHHQASGKLYDVIPWKEYLGSSTTGINCLKNNFLNLIFLYS